MRKLSDEELKILAIDIYDGKVFTDRHLENIEDAGMVFMPLALGALSKMTEEEFMNIGLIYEYISNAGPRSVNDYPTFLSFRMLELEDTEVMVKFHEEYKELKENFVNQ